uniref:Uncharacterized protein n=1 Tax=Plectus sambesii TaxID=2011161 RepID=A0A914VNW4_9BILA
MAGVFDIELTDNQQAGSTRGDLSDDNDYIDVADPRMEFDPLASEDEDYQRPGPAF